MTRILSLENSFFCFLIVAGYLMYCIFATFLSLVQIRWSSVTKKYFLSIAGWSFEVVISVCDAHLKEGFGELIVLSSSFITID